MNTRICVNIGDRADPSRWQEVRKEIQTKLVGIRLAYFCSAALLAVIALVSARTKTTLIAMKTAFSVVGGLGSVYCFYQGRQFLKLTEEEISGRLHVQFDRIIYACILNIHNIRPSNDPILGRVWHSGLEFEKIRVHRLLHPESGYRDLVIEKIQEHGVADWSDPNDKITKNDQEWLPADEEERKNKGRRLLLEDQGKTDEEIEKILKSNADEKRSKTFTWDEVKHKWVKDRWIKS